MHEDFLVRLASIAVVGGACQWIAWRFRFPSILLLLLAGFIIGPVTGFLDPDTLFGDLLTPLVAFSVAIILFEGGLTLRFSELRETIGVIRNLVTTGAAITFAIAALSARFLLELDWGLSTLVGAILVVSGPTVIGPLLLHVRPNDRLSATLKWEGILIDPIGALLALLVFEVILGSESHSALVFISLAVVKTIAVGGVMSVLGAGLLILLIKRYWLPEHLQNPLSLAVLVATFTLSNLIQEESGLLSVTVMGIILANQKTVRIQEIVDFKEDLRVVLLSSLFVLLVARLQWEQIAQVDGRLFLFLGVLIFVARPIAVWASAAGSSFTWNERMFLAWLSPRGIVAASVASMFSLRLTEEGYAGANQLVPITFFVILGTVLVYGLTAAPVARLLKVKEAHSDGVLIVGAHAWARSIAKFIKEAGYHVLLADKDRTNVYTARMAGLPAFYGNILSEYVMLGGIGRVLSLSSSDNLNALASVHFSEIFGRKEVYQLVPEESRLSGKTTVGVTPGRCLFGEKTTYSELNHLITSGYTLKKSRLTVEFGYDRFRETYKDNVIPLFLIDEERELTFFTLDDQPTPSAGQEIVALVRPAETSAPQSSPASPSPNKAR